jgi:carboxyl-terminal processing protease
MSGTWRYAAPRHLGRGAALTLVFAGVLATGAATGSWRGDAGDAARAGDAADRVPAGAVAGDAARRPGEGASEARELVSRSGDRWSAAYSAREYEGFAQSLDGTYVGIGITVGTGRDPDGRRTVEVDRVLPGSPAARAGVRAGDVLRAVDGRAVARRPVTEVTALLRGATAQSPTRVSEPGTPVALDLARDGRTWTWTVRRARLEAESVRVDRPRADTTHIRVSCFTEGSGERVRRAVREAPEGTGFVLDLRGNSGGLVSEATAAGSAFLDGGLVATYEHSGAQRALYAEPGGDTESPLVVLVDGGTMSAAEMLTGALSDRGRSVVVGSRTFGKGTVQVPRRMPDGSVAELTVGRYATPSGGEVPATGLTPDLVVTSGSEAEERAHAVLSGLAPRS